jgi:hypothetical protein
MLYMVIERFKPGAAPEIYRRLRAEGRHLVDGLEYVASWVDHDFAVCWQIMKTDDRALLEAWCAGGRARVSRLRDCPRPHLGGGCGGDGCSRRVEIAAQLGAAADDGPCARLRQGCPTRACSWRPPPSMN